MSVSKLGRISFSTAAAAAVVALAVAGPAAADPVESGGASDPSGGVSGGVDDSSSGSSSDGSSSGGAGVGQASDPVIPSRSDEGSSEPDPVAVEDVPEVASGDPGVSEYDPSLDTGNSGEVEDVPPPADDSEPVVAPAPDPLPAEPAGDTDSDTEELAVVPDASMSGEVGDPVPPEPAPESFEATDAGEDADEGEGAEELPEHTRVVEGETPFEAGVTPEGNFWDPINYNPNSPEIASFEGDLPLQAVSSATGEITVYNPNPNSAAFYYVLGEDGEVLYAEAVAPGETIKIKSDKFVAGQHVLFLAASEVDENKYYHLYNEPTTLVISDVPPPVDPDEEEDPDDDDHDPDDGEGDHDDGDDHDGDHDGDDDGDHDDHDDDDDHEGGGHHGGGGHDDDDDNHHGGGHYGGDKPDHEEGDKTVVNIGFTWNVQIVTIYNVIDNSSKEVNFYEFGSQKGGVVECEGVVYDIGYSDEVGYEVVSHTVAGQTYQGVPQGRGVKFPTGVNPTSAVQDDGGPEITYLALGVVGAAGLATGLRYGGRALIRRRRVGGSSEL